MNELHLPFENAKKLLQDFLAWQGNKTLMIDGKNYRNYHAIVLPSNYVEEKMSNKYITRVYSDEGKQCFESSNPNATYTLAIVYATNEHNEQSPSIYIYNFLKVLEENKMQFDGGTQ